MSHTLCKVKDIPERCSMIELTYWHRSDRYAVSIPVSNLDHVIDHRALFSTIFNFAYAMTFYRRVFVCHSCLKIMSLIDMSETASVPLPHCSELPQHWNWTIYGVAYEFLCLYILTTREKQFQKEFYLIVSGWWWWKKKIDGKLKHLYTVVPQPTLALCSQET